MIKRISIIILGSLIYAIATCVFIIPNHVVLGGTSGLAVLINKYLSFISSEQLITIFNVILMIIAFLLLGKKVAFGTLFGSLFTTFFIFLFDAWFVKFSGLHIGSVVEVIFGSALIGFASSILFFNDASSGGTDIIALIIKNYSKINISKALFISDIILCLLAFGVYGFIIGCVSVLGFLIKIISISFVEKILKK